MAETTITKNPIICYDLNIIPDGITADKILYMAEKTGYLIYDSFNAVRNGCPKPYPYMINPEDASFHIFLDISDENNREIYNKILKEIDSNGRI